MEKYGVGSKHITNEGYEIEIVEKIDYKKRRIKFENGHEVEVYINDVGTGTIKNPYHPSVYGVGYLGVGEYGTKIGGKTTQEYDVWKLMLRRCYDDKSQEKRPTYKDTTICEEWKNFQNFAKWYKDNYPKIEGVKFDLDKDLMQKDIKNKVYSPETCTFLPKNINTFFTNKQSDNTSGFIGVGWNKRDKRWIAQINLFGENKKKFLGCFTTPEEASQVYQSARAEQAEKAKDYLRSLNYLQEEIIQLVK